MVCVYHLKRFCAHSFLLNANSRQAAFTWVCCSNVSSSVWCYCVVAALRVCQLCTLPVFDEQLDQFLPQAHQAMVVLAWETVFLAFCPKFAYRGEKVKVWREGADQVQDVAASVVAHNALAFHRRAQLHLFSFLVQHMVALDPQVPAGLLQQLHKPLSYEVTGYGSFSVYWPLQ